MPAKDLKELLERIHTRLDESFVGIGAQVSHLEAADLAELLNQLTIVEAATVLSMLPVAERPNSAISRQCDDVLQCAHNWNLNAWRKFFPDYLLTVHRHYSEDGCARSPSHSSETQF